MLILAEILKQIPNATIMQSKVGLICANIGCCSGCILRYLGIRSADLYRRILPKGQPVTFITPNTSFSVQLSKDVVCPACLGFLQMDFNDLANNGIKLMLKEKYALYENTFNLAIKLPPQLIIRHFSVVHHIKNKLLEIEKEEFHLPNFVEVKELFKYLTRDEFAKLSKLEFDVKSPFAYTLYLGHEETNEDYIFLTEIPHSKFVVKKSKKRGKTIYQGASLDKVTKAVSLITAQDYVDHSQSPPTKVKTLPVVEESFLMHSQIYIAGRYCKLKRHISNSPWIIGGKRLTEDSCEELISQFITPVFQNNSYKFSSSGREDADVLMLGRGRPFYFELVNPRKTFATKDEMAELQRKINQGTDGKIKVYDLQVCTREETNVLRNSAATKMKSYRCMVDLMKPVTLSKLEEISAMKEIEVEQQNPTRVPRRADLLREKVIHEIIITPISFVQDECRSDENDKMKRLKVDLVKTIQVDLRTSAGTYVKEFMHGDNGRTNPNIHTLLECDGASVISLDVLEVLLDWPPQIECED